MKEADTLPLNRLTNLTKEQQTDRLLRAALRQNCAVALWRMPGSQEQHLLIDLEGKGTPVYPEVEKLPAGFLFSPYKADLSAPSAREDKPCLLLKADLHFTTEFPDRLQLASGLPAAFADKADALIEEAFENQATADQAPLPFFSGKTGGLIDTQESDYLDLVQNAVENIRGGSLQKVVCARTKVLPLPEDFQPFHFFSQLCAAYPNTFVSFVSVPGPGSWMGASPETLISIDKDKTFRTMALAGTQLKSAAESPADAVWRQKEIEEQALVSRYIINCFKKIRLREFEEYGPRTVVAGNLMHLRTDFSVNMAGADFPHLGSTMLELLHPTSAVCGMPRNEAIAFLEEKEGLDRQFFAGFLGPVNLQESSCLFVNLRCMQLLENQCVLYAGAGITADSKPAREWKETEDKIATLASLIYR